MFSGIASKKIYAVVIGIDGYDDKNVPQLSGCVNDAIDVWEWLTKDLKVPSDQINTLISQNPNTAVTIPPSLNYGKPTRQNIDDAFNWIKSKATQSDTVFIHYSAHGHRTRTIYDHKRPGFDEMLVPMDHPKGKFLRDVEFGKLLDELGTKVQHVFAVLDCCHSGGATRGDDFENEDDDNNDEEDEEDDKEDVNEERGAIRFLAGDESEEDQGMIDTSAGDDHDEAGVDVSTKTSWQFESKAYILLAAAQPNEYARETGKVRANGRLTRNLLEQLRIIEKTGRSTTYRLLLHNIRGAFRQKGYKWQNPMLYGNGNQFLFQNKCSSLDYDGTITKHSKDGSVFLDVGAAHGVVGGDEYEIHDLGSSTVTNTKVIGKLKVTDVQRLHSNADVLGKINVNVAGYPIVLRSRGSDYELYVRSALTKSSEPARKAIDTLRKNWRSSANVVLPDLGDTQGTQNSHQQDRNLGFEIDVESTLNGEEYILKDAYGKPLPHIPSLPVGGDEEAQKVKDVLRHVMQFTAMKLLKNPKSRLPSRKFEFGLISQNKDLATGTHTVQHGDVVTMRIKNCYPKPPRFPMVPKDTKSLYAYVFNLTPKYGVIQLRQGQLASSLVEPLQELFETFPARIPKSLRGEDSIYDIVKVIVTTSPTDFDILAQDDLDDDIDSGSRKAEDDRLQRMLELIMADFGMRYRGKSKHEAQIILGDWRSAQEVVQTNRKK